MKYSIAGAMSHYFGVPVLLESIINPPCSLWHNNIVGNGGGWTGCVLFSSMQKLFNLCFNFSIPALHSLVVFHKDDNERQRCNGNGAVRRILFLDSSPCSVLFCCSECQNIVVIMDKVCDRRHVGAAAGAGTGESMLHSCTSVFVAIIINIIVWLVCRSVNRQFTATLSYETGTILFMQILTTKCSLQLPLHHPSVGARSERGRSKGDHLTPSRSFVVVRSRSQSSTPPSSQRVCAKEGGRLSKS